MASRAPGSWLQVRLAVLVRERDQLAWAARNLLGEKAIAASEPGSSNLIAAAIYTAWP